MSKPLAAIDAVLFANPVALAVTLMLLFDVNACELSDDQRKSR